MTTITFIKFDGIDGESTSKDHKGEVDVLSWRWGLTAAAGSGGGAGGGAGKATPQDLHIVHRYDKASPLLGKAAASGKHLKSAVLSARKTGQGQKDFFQITLKEVFITAVSASDDGSGATEDIAMSYAEIDFSYKPQDDAGRLGAAVSFDWNIKTGKVT